MTRIDIGSEAIRCPGCGRPVSPAIDLYDYTCPYTLAGLDMLETVQLARALGYVANPEDYQ